MIDAEAEFYRHGYAAVHRGIHTLSAQATEKMENVRKRASLFINARSAEELVFVRGTTEGINLVANSWGNSNVRVGDNIIISQMEHHANIVPWQMLCARVGAELRVIPLNPDGTLQLETLPTLFDEKTRLLAITHVSNVLGTENPLAEMITLAHQHGAKVLVDGAQAVMHHPVDVQALDCDFYVFSGHKLYGPTGIGILYVKEALLQEMPPWEGGGSMIATVSLSEGTTWTKAPWRFEAGTPNTGDIIGLGAALEYVSALGLNNIAEYEQNLMHYALSQLESVPDLTLYGPQNRLGVIAFNLGLQETVNQASGALQKNQNGADIPGKDTFTKNIGACRAYSAWVDIGGDSQVWTTAQFISWLESQGAFNHPYWMCKGSWAYANNKVITDTGCGNICLAGAVVEVTGTRGAMTIRVTTPGTSSGGGITNAQFTYINHGDAYAPGWRRDYNTKNQQPAFALGQTGSRVANDKAVGWNWNSGVYDADIKGATALILHFNKNTGSCEVYWQ